MSELHHRVFKSSEELLDAIVNVKALQKKLESALEGLLDELDRRLKTGQVDPGGFSHNGWSFAYSEGKRKWEYPTSVTALAQQLKSAQVQALADGSATATTGAPFWTIKGPNS